MHSIEKKTKQTSQMSVRLPKRTTVQIKTSFGGTYAGEHSAAHPLPLGVGRVGGPLLGGALHPAPALRHDAGRAERLRRLRRHLRAAALHADGPLRLGVGPHRPGRSQRPPIGSCPFGVVFEIGRSSRRTFFFLFEIIKIAARPICSLCHWKQENPRKKNSTIISILEKRQFWMGYHPNGTIKKH